MTKGTLPNPGTYTARRNPTPAAPNGITIEAKESGSLLCWIAYALCNSEVNYTGKHNVTLGQKDGTVNQRNVANLKKIFPDWDGLDPFALEQVALPEDQNAAEFELADCHHDDSYTPPDAEGPIIQFKAQWLNPLGGATNMPAQMDDAARKRAMTEWGGKFRAASGGARKPTTAPAAKPASAPAPAAKTPQKPAASGPPSRKGSPAVGGQPRSMTQDEVWQALVAANGGEEADQDALSATYWEKADEVVPGNNGELTPAQWGKVATALGV